MEFMPIVPIAGVLAILFAIYLARDVLGRDTGTVEMQQVGDIIFEAATAFLRRQYQTIAMLAVVAAILVGLVLAFLAPGTNPTEVGIKTAIAFLVGAAASALSGLIGMYVAVTSNVRTAAAARHSLNDAITVSLRGGAGSGFIIVALSLLGVTGIYYAYGANPLTTPSAIVGFGFGASFVALFAQLGGGIYTKAADMGADLVGKVEAGIPEDDPRNPAVIADLVGDNVGDCAGRGADLFESTAAENIGAMILGVGLYPFFGLKGILFPLVARAFGLVASIVGVMVVKCKENEDPMAALNRGYYVTSLLAIIGFFFSAKWLLAVDPVAHPEATSAWFYFFLCGVIGILMAQAFVYITQYYTESKYRPVKAIAEASQTGPATNIIAGVAVGLECTAIPVIVISIAIIASYYLGGMSGVPHAGLFGTAVATMGMLGTAAYILAMDTF